MRVRRRRPEAERMCSTCKQAVARRGQWDCRGCANEALRRFRARRKQELEELRRRVGQLR
jgi:hypothetical protein